ncbi:MAG: lipoprotein [Cardiobacterium sp.]
MFRFFALFIVAALFAGCGQKGPLFLPEKAASSGQQEAGSE